MAGMNQFGIQYTYTHKCNSETLYTYIKPTKMSFFKKGGQKGKKHRSCLGVDASGGGGGM
jgi:hypothetical protein